MDRTLRVKYNNIYCLITAECFFKQQKVRHFESSQKEADTNHCIEEGDTKIMLHCIEATEKVVPMSCI